jgi:uncharacterized coiled-coil protein SlyX
MCSVCHVSFLAFWRQTPKSVTRNKPVHSLPRRQQHDSSMQQPALNRANAQLATLENNFGSYAWAVPACGKRKRENMHDIKQELETRSALQEVKITRLAMQLEKTEMMLENTLQKFEKLQAFVYAEIAKTPRAYEKVKFGDARNLEAFYNELWMREAQYADMSTALDPLTYTAGANY